MPGNRPDPTPLVGREAEIESLESALVQAAGGTPTVVMLTGSEGVGKTRLAREGIALAHAAGFASFGGRAYGLVQDVAYAPFTEAFGAWLRGLRPERISALVGDLPQLSLLVTGLGIAAPAPLGDPALERARLMDGFARLIERLADERPLALLIDDVHRADAATSALLPYLITTVSDRPILLILTARSEDGPAPQVEGLVRELARSAWRTRHHEVTPMTPGEANLLVDELLGDAVDPPLSRLIVERCAGRPLFIEAVTRTLSERGLLTATGGRLRLLGEGIPLPDDVLAQLRDRLAPLGEDERRAVRLLAASAGGGLTVELLTRAARRPVTEILQNLDSLYRRGLVVVSGSPTSYDVAHGLLRDTVLAELSPAALGQAHAILAGALMERHPEDPRIPGHVLAAGAAVEAQRALAELRRGAAYASRVGATEDVVRYLAAAVATARGLGATELVGDLLAELSRSLQWLGDVEGADRRGREALAAYSKQGDALGAARMERELAMLAWSSGDLEQVRAGLAAAGRTLTGLEPSPEHAWLLHAELMTAIRVGADPAAEAAAGRLRALTGRFGSPTLRVHGFLAEGALRLASTDYVAATELTGQALEAASAAGDELLSIRAHDQLSVAAACQMDLPALSQHSQAALDLARKLGAPVLQAWPLGRMALVRFLTGDWDGALRAGAEALAVHERTGDRRGAVSGLAAQAWLMLHRGRLADARRYLEQARDMARPALEADANVFNAALLVEASLALAEADPSRARELGAPLENLRGGWFPLLAAAVLGEAMLRSGDIEGGRRIGARIAAVRSCSTGLPFALTAWLEGQADVAAGDRRAGAERLAAAQGAMHRVGLPYHAARATLAWADAVSPSAPGEAVDAGRSALETFDRLGAPLEAQRARAVLRALGFVPSRGRGRSPGRAAMSDRELEVARLVAAGLTNAEIASALFISPRTVTTHLNRIYERLELSSRVALTRYLVDGGLLEGAAAIRPG